MIYQKSNIKYQIYSVNIKYKNSNIKSSDVKIRAYQFSLRIIDFINSLPNKRAFWSIGDQLLRSATSIGANIIEGQASSSKREFVKFCEIALKSANETKYWICLLRDSYPDLKVTSQSLLDESKEISNMLGASVLTLKGKRSFNI